MKKSDVKNNEHHFSSPDISTTGQISDENLLLPLPSLATERVDALEFYLQQIILVPKPLPIPKILGQSIATVIGSIGGTPYIQAALNAGKSIEIPYIGYFFATCTVIGYGSGAIWCLNSNFNRLYPRTYAEKQLIKNKASYSFSSHVISNLLGLVITIVPGYTAYKYNSIEWFSYVAAVIAAFVSYNFNIFGFYTLLDVMQPSNIKRQLSNINSLRIDNQSQYQPIPNSITKLASTVNLAKIAINQLGRNEIDTLFNQFFEDSITSEDFIAKLQDLAERTSLKDYSRKLYFIQMIALLIPISNTIVNSYLAFGASKLVVDSNYFAAFLIVLTAIPYFFLNAYVILGGVKQISEGILSIYSENPSSMVLAKHFPYLNTFVNISAFCLAVLSAAQTGYITVTTVPTPLNWVVATIILTSSVIFESHILSIILKIPVEYLIGKYSADPFYRKMLLIQNQLDKLQAILGLMSGPHFEGSNNNETSPLLINLSAETNNSISTCRVRMFDNSGQQQRGTRQSIGGEQEFEHSSAAKCD